MKKTLSDLRLVAGILFVHLLVFLTFTNTAIFWHIFSASMLFLITYTILIEEFDNSLTFKQYILPGILSGVGLYGIFFIGNSVIKGLNLPLADQVSRLYSQYAPQMGWQYLALFFIIIPGEEIFWRGFIQKRITKSLNLWSSILFSSLLYTSVQFYSGSVILSIAALLSGIFWGFLYAWKKSIHLVIVSHLIFDLTLFVFFPLY